MKYVFLGSPPFAVSILAHLLDSPYEPSLVVTPPARRRGRGRKQAESPVAELAAEAGIPVLQPETVRDPAVVERLRAEEADVFLVASYGEFLREEFLELPKVACLNVHPSLLPRWRGATPVQAAILAGDEETGTTIQRVVLELDAGDVLVQKRAPMLPGESAGELAGRLASLSGEAAVEALRLIDTGEAVYTPQDPEQVTKCRKLSKEDGHMDWRRSAAELERHVLAMSPWPLAHTALPGGTHLGVWRAAQAPLLDADVQGEPGTVLAAKNRLLVATGKGALELLEVQAAGKRAMAASDFLRGVRLEAGERLA